MLGDGTLALCDQMPWLTYLLSSQQTEQGIQLWHTEDENESEREMICSVLVIICRESRSAF